MKAIEVSSLEREEIAPILLNKRILKNLILKSHYITFKERNYCTSIIYLKKQYAGDN